MSRETMNNGDKQQDSKLLARCRDAIKKTVPGATVVLYGSRARGTQRRILIMTY